MSTTLYEITVVYLNGHTETVHYGWGREPKDGVLHLYDLADGSGRDSRSLVLANVRSYDIKRLR